MTDFGWRRATSGKLRPPLQVPHQPRVFVRSDGGQAGLCRVARSVIVTGQPGNLRVRGPRWEKTQLVQF